MPTMSSIDRLSARTALNGVNRLVVTAVEERRNSEPHADPGLLQLLAAGSAEVVPLGERGRGQLELIRQASSDPQREQRRAEHRIASWHRAQQSHRLLQHRERFVRLSPEEDGKGSDVRRVRDAGLVAQSLGQVSTLVGSLDCMPMVAVDRCKEAVHPQGSHPLQAGLFEVGQKFSEPVPTFALETAAEPELPQRTGHAKSSGPVCSIAQREFKRCSEVGMLDEERRHPGFRCRAAGAADGICSQASKVIKMRHLDADFLHPLMQPLPAVLAKCLQHLIAMAVEDDDGLLDQLGQGCLDVGGGQRRVCAHVAHRIQRGAADKR
jgi:hypothetical protein